MSRIGRSYFALIAEAHTPANTGGLVDLTPSFKVQKSELISALNIVPAVGVAGKLVVTVAGAYAVGDLVRITITSNIVGRQLYRKTFAHTVVAGGTSVTAIALALSNKIAADIGSNNPVASSVPAAGVITITQTGDDKFGLVGYVYTDSAAGTIVNVPTATVLSEGYPDDLVDRGIAVGDINLATYDTVRIELHAEAAIPFIDASGAVSKEIYWFGTPGQGVLLAAVIN